MYEEYLHLARTKKKLEADLDNIKDEIAALEQRIIEEWGQIGATSMKLGTSTLWLDRKLWASADGDTDNAVEAFEAAGHGDFVKKTFNRQTVSAWIRELADPLDSPEQVRAKLPEPLRNALKISETMNVRVRGL